MSISARDLGEEIGVTGATISNILSGRIIKPQGETCKKLLGYCQQYGIDTSELDWNEIIHLYFISSKYAREYDWVSDVDEFGTLKLRHKRCGRITTVPIMGLDGASMPCIFCWVDNYISKDAYIVELNSDTTEYTVKHKHCRHVYTVTYEQIKQKKFRCPRCFGNGEGKNDDVDYGKRQDYRFITDPDKIIIPKKAEPEEFVFEDDDTPLDELSFESFLSSFKAHGITKLPARKALQAEIEQLISEKDGLYNTYHEQKQRFKELQTVKRNIDQILRRDEPHRRKEQSHER